MKYFSFIALFLFLSGGSSWAQSMTCTYCSFGSTVNNTSTEVPVPSSAYAGAITLTGTAGQPSVFAISGTGNITLSGSIGGTGGGGLTIRAMDLGTQGNETSLTFGGSVANTYSGPTTLVGVTLGGSGYVSANSPTTVSGGGTIFGGAGKGNNGTLTTGDLTFSAQSDKLAVHAASAGNSLTNTVSVVKVGETGAGSLTAANGLTIDILDPINGPEGDYTVIATTAAALPLAENCKLGVNKSGRCVTLLSTPEKGIQLHVLGAYVSSPKILCQNSSINLVATGGNVAGTWSVSAQSGTLGTPVYTPPTAGASSTSRVTFTAGNRTGSVTLSYEIGTCTRLYAVTVNAIPTLTVAPISYGTENGTTPNVCAKGTASNNQSIVLQANYGTGKPPSPSSATWTLVPATVSVDGAAPTADNSGTQIITGTFNGYNSSDADISYSVIYNDGFGCQVTTPTNFGRINTQLHLVYSDNTITQNMCPSGTHIVTVSNMPATRSSQAVTLVADDPTTHDPSAVVSFNPTNTGRTNTAPGAWQSVVTGQVAGTAALYAVDADGCRSEAITAVVNSDNAALAAFTVPAVWNACSGASVAALTPTTAGTNLTYTWAVSSATGAKTDALGLSDNATPSSQISGFQASMGAAATPLMRDLTVTGRANGCVSTQPLRIVVSPLPISDDYPNFALCNGVEKTITPTSGATDGLAKPDGFVWSKDSGADVGITYPASGVYPTSLTFRGVNNMVEAIIGDVAIVPYNSATGCSGARHVTKITINHGPSLSIEGVCPKGVDTGNINILITATYTGITKPAHPPTESFWAFSNPSVVDWTNVVFTYNGFPNKNTVFFQGVAASNGMPNVYRVTYSDGVNCEISLTSQIDPPITLRGTPPDSFCEGAVFTATADQANGFPITFSSDAVNVATVSPTRINQGLLTTQVTATGKGVAKIRVANKNGCKSEPLTVVTRGLPVLDNLATLALCTGQVQRAWKPVPDGATTIREDDATADLFKWVLASGTSNNNVGLADNPETGKGMMDEFTAINAGTAPLTRTITITGINSYTSCLRSKNLSIVVNPAVSISVAKTNLCSGGRVNDLITSSTPGGSWNIYNEGTTQAADPVVLTLIDGSASNLKTVTVDVVTAPVTRSVVYTAVSNCKSNLITFTINPSPTMNPIAGRALCGNAQQRSSMPTGGSELTAPTHFKWQNLAAAANKDDVGLPDWTTNWSKTAIDGFTAKDPTDNIPAKTQLVRNVTVTPYNSTTGCLGEDQTFTITVVGGILLAADNTSLCSGQTANNSITITGDDGGNWGVYSDTAATVAANPSGLSFTNGSVAKKVNVTAAAVSSITNNYVVKVGTGASACRSNVLSFTINPPPVMNPITNFGLCAKDQKMALTPPSQGVDAAAPTHFKWQNLATATNRDDVGLPDSRDWSMAIDGFTAKDPEANSPAKTRLLRDITVTPRNATTGCTGESQTFTITVEQELMLTADNISPICNGTATSICMKSNLSHTTYTWSISQNTSVSGQSEQTTPITNPSIAQSLTSNSSTTESVIYAVTGASANCVALLQVSVEILNTSTSAPSVSGGGEFCTHMGTEYITNLMPRLRGAENVQWAYTSYAPLGQEASVITGNTQKETQGSLTNVADHLVISGAVSGSIFYKFRPFTACLGDETPPVQVTVNATPVANAPSPAAPMVCSGTVTNIGLSSPALYAGTQYTWTVDKTNGPDVSGYTQPTTSKSSPISDPLVLANGKPMESIDYVITPWLGGCSGATVRTRVTVNPIPTVSPPANLELCSGVTAPAKPLSGTNSTTWFKWTGGASAGLADSQNADQTEDNFVNVTGLPAFTAVATDPTVTVNIWGRNDNGCVNAAPAAFNITVHKVPIVSFNPEVHPKICTGATIGLAGSTHIGLTSAAGTTYTWNADYLPTTGLKDDVMISLDDVMLVPFAQSTTTPEASPIIKKLVAKSGSGGTVTFTITPSIGGCIGQLVTMDVPVIGSDIASTVVNNSPYVCSGLATNIVMGTAGESNTYSWTSTKSDNVTGNSTNSVGMATTIIDDLTLSDKKEGWAKYYITAKSADCIGPTKVVTINVDPTPTVKVTPETAQTICSGTATNITLSSNFEEEPENAAIWYSWKVAGPANVGAVASDAPVKTFTQQTLSHTANADETATYTFIAWYNPTGHLGCAGPAAKVAYTLTGRVSAGPITIANANDEDKVCLGDVATLKANAQGGGTLSYQWWNNAVLMDSAAEASYTLPTTVVSKGSYAVSVSNDCDKNVASAAKTVEVSGDAYFTNGTGAAASPTAPNVGDIVQFTYTGPDAAYQWDFGDNTFKATVRNPSHLYSNGGTFNPLLKVSKLGNSACMTTIMLSPLTVSGIAYDPPTGDTNTAFTVFPIPAHSQLTIQSEGHLTRLTVSDLSGKNLMNVSASGHQATLALGGLAGGIYILTVVGSQGVKHVKIIKD